MFTHVYACLRMFTHVNMFTHVYACLRMFTHVYAIQPLLRIFIVFAQYFTLSGAAGPGTAGAGDTRGLADRRHPDGDRSASRPGRTRHGQFTRLLH